MPTGRQYFSAYFDLNIGKFSDSPGSSGLPSLFRFIFTIAVLAGLVYLGMLALVTFVTPEPHEIVQTLPASRLNK
ncbi:hypothetical protein DES32_0602 [Methylovirgula ligni]|uniref:Uncharacterized protein n=1 Tax=Methylovirgula ligni TaxID=569860 RepID=A0A3D9Z2Q3_9HYPH|nr:hypothetical protein DES32_0602 [Methylovirgula ligni]